MSETPGNGHDRPVGLWRFTRPSDPERRPRFFVSPCELAPPDTESVEEMVESPTDHTSAPAAPDGGAGALEVVRRLVAERAELPSAAVHGEHRVLGDLHLNSIPGGEIVAQAARQLGQAPPPTPMQYASATVSEVARTLEERAGSGTGGTADGRDEGVPAGVGPWVRAFTPELVEEPLPRVATGARDAASGGWQVIAPAGHPLAEPLQAALGGGEGGVVVCLPPDPGERHVGMLLEGARAVLSAPAPGCFVLVQHGGGAAAFARTLHLEAPRLTVCVVDVPAHDPMAVERVLAEIRAADGYVEAHYDAAGRRCVPRLCPAAAGEEAVPALHPGDVLLVTGGGNGITAECALALACDTGARLVLMGKSRPEEDVELRDNLERFAAAGVRALYFAVDVTDAAAVCEAVRAAEAELGAVTAVLHGAAVNTPRPITALDEAAFLRTLAPKVQGARNVLAAVDPGRLRLLVGFGSIIARMGMPGTADYALGNEWLARLVERFGAEHPACLCLTLEWSIWSGVGMGARLGRLDALMRAGISPISPEDGVAALRALLARTPPAPSLVVTGRFGDLPTLRMDLPELPLYRFLEHPRVHYPGVELVADARLSAGTDPYLEDHVLRGERLLPAVMGLEAMAQVARALLGTTEAPVFEEVRFERPVVIPAGGSLRVRVAALARGPGEVELVLRSEGTAFQVDHFRAVCRFGHGAAPGEPAPGERGREVSLSAEELHGMLLFHSGRFRRISGYRRLRARSCEAEIVSDGAPRWFGSSLPPDLALGDPGARDAAIHAIQACIPHALVLPVGVGRLHAGVIPGGEPHSIRAREVADEGNELVYDVEVLAQDGRVRERWEKLRLRRVGSLVPDDGWPQALLTPYVERRVAELVPGAPVSVVIERSRAADLTLGVTGTGALGCDLERVVERPEAQWRDLLGPAGLALAEQIARETEESRNSAATRVWTAGECLRKSGIAWGSPLAISTVADDGWVVLAGGGISIPTCVVRLRGGETLAVAMLVGSAPARS